MHVAEISIKPPTARDEVYTAEFFEVPKGAQVTPHETLPRTWRLTSDKPFMVLITTASRNDITGTRITRMRAIDSTEV